VRVMDLFRKPSADERKSALQELGIADEPSGFPEIKPGVSIIHTSAVFVERIDILSGNERAFQCRTWWQSNGHWRVSLTWQYSRAELEPFLMRELFIDCIPTDQAADMKYKNIPAGRAYEV